MEIDLKELIRRGTHLGHKAQRTNPKMFKYIFKRKNNVDIIDLRKTITLLKKAYDFIIDMVAKTGKKVLFVGTKLQAKNIVEEVAKEVECPYVNERWIGGTLTNFDIVIKQVAKLNELESIKQNEEKLKSYSKKEISKLQRIFKKLHRNYAGLKKIDGLPGVIVVIDPDKEIASVREATIKKIPIIALIDTDGDPDLVTIPIPCNDEALRVIQYILPILANAVKEGLERRKKEQVENMELAKVAQ
ncbi:MAG: 30S ribosomal protein S2 [Planctomycetota bacterium]